MKNVRGRTLWVLAGLAVTLLLSGCTDWKKKHDGLMVEHQNLLGRYETCMSQLDTTAGREAKLTRDLDATRRELEALRNQPDRTGLGEFGPEINVPQGTITVTLDNTILFASGKAEIKNSVISELDKIASVLKQRYRDKDVSVVGHTDTDPINKTKDLWKDNWDLSSARALAVLRYLVKRGIEPNHIKAVAAGEFRPVADNTTAGGKAKNRRVQIVIHMF